MLKKGKEVEPKMVLEWHRRLNEKIIFKLMSGAPVTVPQLQKDARIFFRLNEVKSVMVLRTKVVTRSS